MSASQFCNVFNCSQGCCNDYGNCPTSYGRIQATTCYYYYPPPPQTYTAPYDIWSHWWIYFVIAVSIILCSVIIICCVYHRRKKNKSKLDEIIVDSNSPSVGMGYDTMGQPMYMNVPLQTRQDNIYI